MIRLPDVLIECGVCFQIAKVCHCVWTGLLPGSVYLFALAFFSSTASAVLAASLVALSEPLLVLGTHTLVNSLVSPLLFAALAIAISIANHTLEIKDRALDAHNTNGHSGMEKTTRPDEESRSVESSSILTNHPSIYLLWWLSVPITGVVLGILCYVRVDLLLFVGILVVTTYSTRIPNMISRVGAVVTVITSFGLSFISGLILAGYTDRLFYGHWFITPIQWFRFNVHRDLATEIFGGHSWFLYIRTILIQDPVFLLLILVSVYGSIQLLRSSRDTTALKLLVCLVLLVIVYSTKGHKEVRFLHDWIVLTLVFCGHGIFVVSSHITNRSGQETWHRTALLLSLLAVFAASSYYRFPRAEDGSNKRWAYKRATDSGYVNLCLQWVGQQADATGVFVDHDVHGFGGYTVLQKRIPIIAKMNEEFREWDTATRKRSASLYAVNGFHNATSFDDFGLWVTVQNVQRLVKYLLMSSTYNYAVVSTDRQFLEVGFNEIKRFGSVRVLQRDNSEQMRQRLYKMGDGMAYGKDPDILETEGRTLYTSGFYSQALERLKAAIEMDPKRIQLRDLVRDAQLKIHSVNRNRRQFKQ